MFETGHFHFFFKFETEQIKVAQQDLPLLKQDETEQLESLLIPLFTDQTEKYHWSLSKLTSKSHKKLPLPEKITCLKVLHDLLDQLMTTRSLLEDLELNRTTSELKKLLLKSRRAQHEDKEASIRSLEDDLQLGKRRSEQVSPLELSSFFSWSE